MLRTSLFTIAAVALATPAFAHDAAMDRAPMDAVTTGTQGCAAARALITDSSEALDGGRCKKLTSARVDGVGSADVYRVTVDDQVRFALEVSDQDGHRWMSALDLDPGKHAPRLRVIHVGGKPAFALDVTSHHQRSFLVCGAHDGTWSCTSAEVASEGRRCQATLSDDGALHTRCAETETLSLR